MNLGDRRPPDSRPKLQEQNHARPEQIVSPRTHPPPRRTSPRTALRRPRPAPCTRQGATGHHSRGNTITLVEERPPWSDQTAADWTSSPIAQFRFQPTSQLWALYWPDRNTRWHLFAETPPTADIAQLAHALDLDTNGTFWG